jgi:outer membrane protein assembly factor BamB
VPLSTNYGRHVAAPIVYGDMVIVGSHEVGFIATRISKKGNGLSADQVWKRDKEAAPNFSSPILLDDYIYMLCKKDVLCLDAKTGETKWSHEGNVTTSPDRAFAAFVGMGKNILMLNDTGELILFKASPAAYNEVSRVQICAKNWCHPAYADGKLIVRDQKNLLCVQLVK